MAESQATKQQEADREKIVWHLKKMAIYWTPIDEIYKLLEGKGVNRSEVIEAVRGSRHFTKAWAPGGKCLMVSNRAKVSDFVSVAEDREAA